MRQCSVTLAIVVILDLLLGGTGLAREFVGVVADEVERDAFRFAEFLAMGFEVVGDLFVRRD